ncbi:MAG: FAD-binding oxidoreductase [Actinomycetota bacterium]|nr:FAD-binding oxidoreductase [Actinomycetota bacterium]
MTPGPAPPGISDSAGLPTPAIAFDRPASDVVVRFDQRVPLDAAALLTLRATGATVDTTDVSRLEAGRDWWPLTVGWAVDGMVPGRPSAIVRPDDAAQVASVLRACNHLGIPVTAAGGRSGVCGASIPVFGGVTLDMGALTGIVDVDDQSLLVTVRPGTFGDQFETELRAEHRLTLGHWPQSISISTVGGWLACRSAGQYSTRYGKIEDMVVGLEVAMADGRLIRTGSGGPRSATGPDLTQLFVGSEGTLGIITEAKLRVHPAPQAELRAGYGFASFAAGLDACRRILRRGATPAVLRLYDQVESARTFAIDDSCALVVVDEGDPGLVQATMTVVAEECGDADPLDEAHVRNWLEHRNQIASLESLSRAGLVVDTVEVAAAWSVLPSLFDQTVAALVDLEGTLAASAHQSHAYTDGACLYFTFAGRPAAGEADSYYQAAWNVVMQRALAHGAAISHHHGIGLNRGSYLPAALGGAFDVLAACKAVLDPAGILNPGKLGLPSPFGEPPWP